MAISTCLSLVASEWDDFCRSKITYRYKLCRQRRERDRKGGRDGERVGGREREWEGGRESGREGESEEREGERERVTIQVWQIGQVSSLVPFCSLLSTCIETITTDSTMSACSPPWLRAAEWVWPTH